MESLDHFNYEFILFLLEVFPSRGDKLGFRRGVNAYTSFYHFVRFRQTNVGGDGVKSRNRLIADLRDSFLYCGRTVREIRRCSQTGL